MEGKFMRESKIEKISSLNLVEAFPRKRPEKKKRSEFKTILDSYLTETAEDLEEYQVHIPRSNLFWDNGYEDVG